MAKQVKSDRDRLQAMADQERVRADDLKEILESLEDVAEWAESLTEITTQLENLNDAVSEYEDSEGDREARSLARETVLSSLGDLLAEIEDFGGKPDLPVMLAELHFKIEPAGV